MKPIPSARIMRTVRYVFLLAASGLAVYFFLIPGVIVARDLALEPIGAPGIPDKAWRMHRTLSARYAGWARARVASGRAAHLDLYDVPGTEWPIFGSVFYLWATEALQEARARDPSVSTRAPAEYAEASIEAAKDLILDPKHHTWVRTHWGEGYMHRENVFFRSLVIAGLTSYERLRGTGRYLPLLREQADTLAAALDASRFGVLDDYPDECYPIDVAAAIGIIHEADGLLGVDRPRFIERSLRAFEGHHLDARGLVPYRVDADTGLHFQPSRGVGNAFVSLHAPDLWPEAAAGWYERFEAYFWQERWWAEGFREFPKDLKGYDWLYDVDAGPVISGFSMAGSAFGIAAARKNGRFDHAYTLTAEALAVSWPLPDGTALLPRILSGAADAPYLGESAILYFLTVSPADGVPLTAGGHLSGLVFLALLLYFGIGLLVPLLSLLSIRRIRRSVGAVS